MRDTTIDLLSCECQLSPRKVHADRRLMVVAMRTIPPYYWKPKSMAMPWTVPELFIGPIANVQSLSSENKAEEAESDSSDLCVRTCRPRTGKPHFNTTITVLLVARADARGAAGRCSAHSRQHSLIANHIYMTGNTNFYNKTMTLSTARYRVCECECSPRLGTAKNTNTHTHTGYSMGGVGFVLQQLFPRVRVIYIYIYLIHVEIKLRLRPVCQATNARARGIFLLG